MKKQWYVGFRINAPYLTAFTSLDTPKPDGVYSAVIGPFRTRRGALWAELYGYSNPHFQHVCDAERFAKDEAK